MLLLLTVVGIRGEGKMFDCGMTDDMPFGVRTANSSPDIILLISGVDRANIGVTRLGVGWPPRIWRGLVKSRDKSRFVFSILTNLHNNSAFDFGGCNCKIHII